MKFIKDNAVNIFLLLILIAWSLPRTLVLKNLKKALDFSKGP